MSEKQYQAVLERVTEWYADHLQKGTADKPLFRFTNGVLTPRQTYEEMRQRTALGVELVEELLDLALDHILSMPLA